MSDESQQAHDVLAAEEFGVPAPDPKLAERTAHDVLAAEEFGVPAPDPKLAEREAHDVLAAEEFGMPAPDPVLKIYGSPIPMPQNPSDPSGSDPPHDILAADEFALPGPGPRAVPPDYVPVGDAAARPRSDLRIGAVLLAVGLVLGRRLSRRRRSA